MSTDVGLVTNDFPLDATAQLPDDPVILQQMIRELLIALRQTRHENEDLQHRLDLLLRRLYGPRTERFDPNQPLLIADAFEPQDMTPNSEEPSVDTAAVPEPATDTPKRRGHGRKGLPKNLPRVPVLHELTEVERCCPECGGLRDQIGAERSEQLDYRPASLFIAEHVRCTYA